MESQEAKAIKGNEVVCERCKKPLGEGKCSRCIGFLLEKKKGIIHVAA